MSNGRIVALASILLSAVTVTCLGDVCMTRTKRKLIEWGWDQPYTDAVRANIAQMEKAPFDGVIMDMQYTRDGQARSFAWSCFGRERIEPALLQHAVEDLQHTRFTTFTDNFLRFNVCPGDADWFDDWSAILSNAQTAARVAKLGGLKGWMFDVEQYNAPCFHYPSQKRAARVSFEQYARQARLRGMEFMQAINCEFPDITILLTFAHSLVRVGLRTDTELANHQYALCVPFLDGMLAAATPQTKLVDAFEMSYPYTDRSEFLEAYHLIRNRAMELSAEPARYRASLQVGFGLWIDYDWRGRGWHTDPTEFDKNLRTPARMEEAIRNALEISDEYVWLYSEQLNWWDGRNVPAEYLEAVRRGRQKVQDIWSDKVLGATTARLDRSARELPGYDDETTFGTLWGAYELVADLPKEWHFKLDPDDEGQAQGWFAQDLDDSQWQTLRIGEWWEPQGIPYDGIAWYRVRFTVPEAAVGRKLSLSFGAVDESAWVYLNGEPVGVFDEGATGWDKRFEIPLGDAVRPGDNLLAVRVRDREAYGGIWKSVKLIATK